MNLCFVLLDEPIIQGRGDEPALGELTFEHLLEDVAAIGGVLRAVEVTPGTPVSLSIEDDQRWCVAALAIARVGAVLSTDEATVGFDRTAALHWGSNELDWQAVLKAGRTDPAAAIELAPTASYDGLRPVADLVERIAALRFPASSPALREVLS